MSTDVKVFNACNHVVNGERYTQDTCPLCRGKSYYKDIAFDNSGKAVLCTGEIKLQQEVLKIMDDPKGGNKFHPNWGDELIANHSHAYLGSKNLPLVSSPYLVLLYSCLKISNDRYKFIVPYPHCVFGYSIPGSFCVPITIIFLT